MEYYEVIGWELCPWCREAKTQLENLGKDYVFSEISKSKNLLNYFKEKYKWDTVPMVILKRLNSDEETFIGGCSDLIEYLGETPPSSDDECPPEGCKI